MFATKGTKGTKPGICVTRSLGHKNMRFLIILLLVLPASALDLARAPLNPPLVSLGACPNSDAAPEALLRQLAGSDYACTEAIARALSAQADAALVMELLAMAAGDGHMLTRRNALRVLGRLADSPRGSRAYELLHRRFAASTRTLAATTLREADDIFLLQDAIWLLDRFYFPTHSALPDLMHLSADSAGTAALRARATRAAGRLIAVQTGALSSAEQDFLIAALKANAPEVRAETADAIARLPLARLPAVQRNRLLEALQQAWQSAPPLRVTKDEAAKTPQPFVFEESSATLLVAQAALARALDRFAPSSQRLLFLKEEYEQLTLAHELSNETITVHSDRADDLAALLEELDHGHDRFEALLGSSFPPLDGETRPLTVLILPHRAAYQEYLRAFTPFAFANDGLYDELSATLYTYRRDPAQSNNTLEQTLRHEYSHYLIAQRIFPGHWRSPGYHDEPKGWIDEGSAELIAGVSHLDTICAEIQPRPLAELLAMRAGYDRFGSFDYAYAWAFSRYLAEQRPEPLRRVLMAYRGGSYRLDHFAQIAGLTVEELEAGWHATMRGWCADGSKRR
jgi:hypothetical protein